jgi:hypothetical protein
LKLVLRKSILLVIPPAEGVPSFSGGIHQAERALGNPGEKAPGKDPEDGGGKEDGDPGPGKGKLQGKPEKTLKGKRKGYPGGNPQADPEDPAEKGKGSPLTIAVKTHPQKGRQKPPKGCDEGKVGHVGTKGIQEKADEIT